MAHRIRQFWKENRLLLAGFVLAAGLVLFFAIRMVMMTLAWHGAPTDPPLEGWMTPRYVAMSWHVPPEVVGDALGLDRESPRRRTLEEIAAERGLTVAELAAALEAAIAAHRAR